MLRTNRLIAPLGMALVSLILAAVPFLFNVAGTDLRFGSRLMSVNNAWNQIASVFVAVYQPGNAAQLLALDYGNMDKGGSPAEKCSGHAEEVACLGPVADPPATAQPIAGIVQEPASQFLWTERTTDTKLQPARCPRVASLPAFKPNRAAVAGRSAPVPPSLPRIDVLKVIELAVKAEVALKLTDTRLADYRIQPSVELSRLVNRNAVSAAYRFTVKRGASGCALEYDQAPKPAPDTREKPRKARTVSAFELQS